MNKEIKLKWIEALRSGNYKQGRGQLRNHRNEYCCLGVLCDIHAQETGRKWSKNNYDGEYSKLNTEVAIWAGLEDANPIIAHNIRCIGANDVHEYSFLDIANMIETNL